MRNQFFTFIFFIYSIKVFSQNPCYSPIIYSLNSIDCPENYPYELVFEDNFDGNSLDLSKWSPITGYIRNFNQEKEWYTPDNIEVKNGTLKLWALKEISPITGTYWNYDDGTNYTTTFDYTSAEIHSKIPFKYGKFEIRCKIPAGKSFWPAFWLFYDHPYYNEIDVFDGFRPHSNCSDFIGNDHCINMGYQTKKTGTQCYGEDVKWDVDTNYSKAFHTYSIEWDEYGIIWRVDGEIAHWESSYIDLYTGQNVNCNSLNGLYYKEYLPDIPMYIIINLAIWKDVDNSTFFPNAFEIDYIKVWKRDKHCYCIPYKLYEATNNLPSSTHVSNYIVAGNDAGISDVGGNVTINENQDVSFTAGNYIDLLPGFSVERGATFNASIEDCSPLNQPEEEDITVTNFPDDFTDKLCVSVNGATKYTIRVEFDNGNTIYYSQNNPINTNPVCVWDGSCNYGSPNCWLYVRCPRSRKVIIDFSNCSKSVSQTNTVHVSCSEKNLQLNDSLNQDLTDNRNFENYNFIISPNPTSGIFTLSCTNTKFSAEISDFLNRKILSSSSIEGVIQFDLSSFPKGIYIVKASTTDGKVYVGKIVYQ